MSRMGELFTSIHGDDAAMNAVVGILAPGHTADELPPREDDTTSIPVVDPLAELVLTRGQVSQVIDDLHALEGDVTCGTWDLYIQIAREVRGVADTLTDMMNAHLEAGEGS